MAPPNAVLRSLPAHAVWRRRLLSSRTLGFAQSGFTYLALLALVLIMGFILAATGEVWSSVQKRSKEQELLFVGHQFRQAIQQYYERSPGGAKRYPRTLDDLLLDNRYPTVQRYLRKIYVDPMTGHSEWGLIKAPDDGIAGIYSLSEEAPLQVAGFNSEDAAFENSVKYSDWTFGYQLALPTASRPSASAAESVP